MDREHPQWGPESYVWFAAGMLSASLGYQVMVSYLGW